MKPDNMALDTCETGTDKIQGNINVLIREGKTEWVTLNLSEIFMETHWK